MERNITGKKEQMVPFMYISLSIVAYPTYLLILFRDRSWNREIVVVSLR